MGKNGYLICDKCGGYYKLQSGESPDDFSRECECGGKLAYKEDSPELEGTWQTIFNYIVDYVKGDDYTPPVPDQDVRAHKIKNPLLALILSGCVLGLGQFYNGNLIKGFCFPVAGYSAVGVFIAMYSSGLMPNVLSFVFMVDLVFFVAVSVPWIWGVYDAYDSAKRINEGRHVRSMNDYAFDYMWKSFWGDWFDYK